MSSLADNLQVRPFQIGEERALWPVFYSSVHGLARSHYSPEQLSAWAPEEFAEEEWRDRIRRNQPFVTELNGVVTGFADVQPSGYIDHFFVAAEAAGKGVGGALMRQLEAHARAQGITRLSAQVSLNAVAFFRHFGFAVEAEQTVVVRGIRFANFRMSKRLGE